jgi:hypothetical protein
MWGLASRTRPSTLPAFQGAAFAFPDGRSRQPRAAPPLAAAQHGPTAARPRIHLEHIVAPSHLALAPPARTPAAASPIPIRSDPHSRSRGTRPPHVHSLSLSLNPSSSRSTRSRRRCPTPIWTPRRMPSRLPLVSRSSARRCRHRHQSSGWPSRCRRGSDRTPLYSSASRSHHCLVVPR